MRNIFVIHLLILIYVQNLTVVAQETEIFYLSGTGNDHAVNWDFMVTKGRKNGSWSSIPVPSCWELQGFGTYNYGHDDPKADEEGFYKYRFILPDGWEGRNIHIVFEGSMTDTEVKINGKPAGPVHQGAFYRFRYDITGLLDFRNDNLLEVKVGKMSSDSSVNQAEREADFWVFGGIYRPVYLEAYPEQYIKRLAIDARADGYFQMDVFPGKITTASEITGQILDLNGTLVGDLFHSTLRKGDEMVRLETMIDQPKLWSPEFPDRYLFRVQLKNDKEVIHEVYEKFGFRTVEVRAKDGIYVNGVKVRLKGVNRHSFWPDAGRTTSRSISIRDANLIRDMNMNAVRMSHYPPDPHFLDACDSLGLFVLDELTGWQDAYSTEVGERLVKETVIRDVNHPSVILWMNGNEGGWNRDLDDDFAKYDPQNRVVLHPWELFNEINTGHYKTYEEIREILTGGSDIFMPTEFLHGLYDGGHGAGLNDYWNIMLRNPLSAGGFLWVLADEGIVRTDRNGILDTDGNHAPDGILGPYREKEGSYYTIKEIWSPVFIGQVELTPGSEGIIKVENRYHFTNLDQCSFSWKLVRFPDPGSNEKGYIVKKEGIAIAGNIPPQQDGTLDLQLPDDWQQNDAILLSINDPHGREIITRTFMIRNRSEIWQRIIHSMPGMATGFDAGNTILVKTGDTEIHFSKTNGQIAGIKVNGEELSLKNGPRMIEGKDSLVRLRHYRKGNSYIITATYTGTLKEVRYKVIPYGWLEVEYSYHMPKGEYNYFGVAFDYPEKMMSGIKWLGNGPFRVWKNRLKGGNVNVWHKKYNDAITGEKWIYPEFKGYHSNIYWMTIETKEIPFTIINDTRDLFIGLYIPEGGRDPRNTRFDFPQADISFMHGISPIGTKFHPPDQLGPESKPNRIEPEEGESFSARLYFYFGELQ